ncbi:MerR family transcriptional regulator [Deinococcus irradiatisoli]|uniref:MerR family transcriptional regulator n=1 Tax=Deinococcus irradiatisoli TaxID=2202254 RepID=A0A2Z3JKA3_9DEIO|nr:helix-turn-helix domain-containing protein [Deinococcus irradiatisoli]AWN22348.1 MerR family transcriptional regulator [Deinococcus irradiatisoli]
MAEFSTRTTMTIGAFSRLSRLSLKALRLYDALGLLSPVQTDEHSGYRYYDPAQLARARQISLLRQLDVPLQGIAELLDAPSAERPARFRALWEGLEMAHRQRRALAEYLMTQVFPEQRSSSMTQPSTSPTFTAQQRFVPEQRVATLTRRVFVGELQAFFEDSARVPQLLRAQGAEPAGPMFALYHGEVNQDSDGPVEICFPYRGEAQAEGDVQLRSEPAHHEAYITLTKSEFEFPQILGAYDAAHAAATQLGECGQLSPREIYTADWPAAGPDDPVGDVAWPFVPRP